MSRLQVCFSLCRLSPQFIAVAALVGLIASSAQAVTIRELAAPAANLPVAVWEVQVTDGFTTENREFRIPATAATTRLVEQGVLTPIFGIQPDPAALTIMFPQATFSDSVGGGNFPFDFSVTAYQEDWEIIDTVFAPAGSQGSYLLTNWIRSATVTLEPMGQLPLSSSNFTRFQDGRFPFIPGGPELVTISTFFNGDFGDDVYSHAGTSFTTLGSDGNGLTWSTRLSVRPGNSPFTLVPEPSTALLLASGLLAMAAGRRSTRHCH